MLNEESLQEDCQSIFLEAVAEGELEIIQECLNYRAVANEEALYEAVLHQHPEIARFLVDSGARVQSHTGVFSHRAEWKLPLHLAAENDDIAMVRYLLEFADGKSALETFDFLCRTPLIIATMRNNPDMVQLLLEAGADVNALDEDGIGWTAISRAVSEKHVDMVELLLRVGADPNKSVGLSQSAWDQVKNVQRNETLFKIKRLLEQTKS